MQEPPDTLEGWITKAKTFHNQKLCIDELRKGTQYSSFRTPNTSAPRNPPDPNAMEIDAVRLKKLSPQEHAKCMREGRCFRCRKTGHDTKNCRTKTNPTSGPSRPPQQVLHTEITPAALPDTKPKSSPFADYARSLGKTEEELLQTLKLCYEDQDEEVKAVETFKELQDF